MLPVVELARWLVRAEREPIPPAVAECLQDEERGRMLGQAAHDHGLAPLLHYRAKQLGLALPGPLAAVAAESYYANLLRATYFYQELAQVSTLAREQGVELIALKGIHVAAVLYPNIATRPMIDIDLLARREQIALLVDALCARGFQEVSREPRAGANRQFEIQTLLVRPGQQHYGCVSLHWSLLDFPFYQQHLRLQDFWERATECDLAGTPMKALGREELLVYLAAHGALHHQWARMIWLCDVALLLEQGAQLDWRRVVETARANALALAVREALRRVSEAFGLVIPTDVWSALEAAPVSAEERRAWEELTVGGRGAGRAFWADLSAIGGIRPRLAFALAHLFPSPVYMRQRYTVGSSLELPVAYVRRWLRGIGSLRAR